MAQVFPAARQAADGSVAMALLAPLLLVQARQTVRRAPRLPGASGPPHGSVGHGDPRRRLLVIGESTAAGVGARAHTHALPGFIATDLSGRLGGTVSWMARGKSGATTRRVLAELVPAGLEPFDVTVLTVGINDLFDRRALRPWAGDLLALIQALHSENGRTRVVVSGLPPVDRAPGIPQPLRFVLGRQARAMDRTMRQVSAAGGATYVPIEVAAARASDLFASDGFHPSQAGYREWARLLAGAVPELGRPASGCTMCEARLAG
jgi:lysophospholipase L1-like esterase